MCSYVFDDIVLYKYFLKDKDGAEIFDGEENRGIDLSVISAKTISVYDIWNAASDTSNVFFTRPFNAVLLTHVTKVKPDFPVKFTHEFRVKAPLLQPGEIICMCGSSGCVRSPLNNCPMRPACHGYDAQVVQLQKYIEEGKNQDDILSAFVKEYGAAVLAIPSNAGFNSLSWLLPYGLAALGLLVLVVTARRWTTQPAAAGAGGVDIPVDPAIDARLDDELRDLD